MEIYSTEEQQEEAIKSFFKENGVQILVGAALGLAGFTGWNMYVDSKIEAQENASMQFEEFIKVAGVETAKSELVDAELDSFVKAHGETGYAIFANLIAAKKAVEAGQLTTAETRLLAASKETSEVSLKGLVDIRLARVQIALEKYDVALTTLASITESAYEARVAEIKGDALLAQGKNTEARQAYQTAADKGGLDGNAILKMKLQDLALSTNVAS
ncbi:YfgM family protein [Psychrosphaera aestuarii]|uniref:YfgM family protein n=1 Tax=Psychrosphaera aestuarii TaxID=1266052 RepID=UPI001B325900|nr:tetratricopeptide repeat protein [Psychrosphaera aestuarii]